MASARYWRLVGILPYGGRAADLELFALHWYSGGARIDASATLTCSHAPAAGALSTLKGSSPSETVRFAAADVRSGGFWLRWDFGADVSDPVPRLGAVVKDRFLGWAILQYSSDGLGWTTDVSFGRVIYPGAGTLTGADPKIRSELDSSLDGATKGPNSSISGRTATVWASPNGFVRSDQARSTGRRVFGLRLESASPPQVFFGGFSSLAGWGPYVAGKHWLAYANDGKFYYYPAGSVIALTPAPGAATASGDTMYFDVNLDAGTAALKKNGGAWSSHAPLPNFSPGSSVVIDLQAPSTSSNQVRVTLLTTSAELAGVIPAGAVAWDRGVVGSDDFQEEVFMATGGANLRTAASAPVPASSMRSASKLYTARDVEFGGAGTVYGTTKAKGSPNTPTKSRVRLLRERDGLLAREVWSDPVTGAFEFTGVDTGTRWVVLAQDASGAFWPAAASSFDVELLP